MTFQQKTTSLAGKILLTGAALLTVGWLWSTNQVLSGHFIFDVKKVAKWSLLETPYLYALLLLFTIAFPLGASLDRRFEYFKKWKFLIPGNLIVAAVFIAWDVFFTKTGVWGFNGAYLSGWRLAGLPWEEWAFFLIIPFSCVFIYESVLYFFKKDILAPAEKSITMALTVLFFAVGFLKWEHIYTSTTFLLCGFFNLYHLLFVKNQPRGRFYLAYLFSFLPFLLVNGALTGGFTENPVVFYNPDEFFGLRFVSIPVDDAAYGYLLLMANFSFYEYFKKKSASERSFSGKH